MCGVYSKGLISYESDLPDYTIASELTGKRVTYFKISDETEEKIYDADGNEVDEIPEDANEEDYTTEEVSVNSDESKTKENYKKAKEIFEGRLSELGVSDYSVRLNEETGEMVVELPDNTITDTLLQYLLCKGDFSMTDSEDGTVLMEKSDIKTASVMYGNETSGEVTVYLDIKFNSEGTKKLSKISKEYIKVEDTSDSENTVEEETTEDESSEETEDTEETQKKVTLTMEDSAFLTTYFGEEMNTGELTLSVGSGTDDSTVYEYATEAQVYAMLLNNGEMPLEYTIEVSEYIASPISSSSLYVAIGIVVGVAAILVIYLICRYRVNGILCSLSFVLAVALFLLLVRYTSTTISIGSLVAMIVLMVCDAYFMTKILNDIKKDPSIENVKSITFKAYLKKIDAIIVLLIIAVVYTFMPEVQQFSIGMVLFYGMISLMISNLLLMRQMLIAKAEK